ncbi:MAG: hypothetical protein ABL901_12090 [Hyphomicrobiaceae bacterium]
MLEVHRARALIAPRSQRSIRTLPQGVALVLAGEPSWKPPTICELIPATASPVEQERAVTAWIESGIVEPQAG